MSKKILLNANVFTIVDDEDYDRLNKYTWTSTSRGYASTIAYKGKIQTRVRMHRMILNCPDHLEVNHINHDVLDNRKSNLRIITTRQKSQNRRTKSSSKYPGVRWGKDIKKWHSKITINGKEVSLGVFDDELEAFKAYEKACNEIGEPVLCKAPEIDCTNFTPYEEIYTFFDRFSTSSIFPGVHWNKNNNKWTTCIEHNKKRYYLGQYHDEEEAFLNVYKKATEVGKKLKIPVECEYVLINHGLIDNEDNLRAIK